MVLPAVKFALTALELGQRCGRTPQKLMRTMSNKPENIYLYLLLFVLIAKRVRINPELVPIVDSTVPGLALALEDGSVLVQRYTFPDDDEEVSRVVGVPLDLEDGRARSLAVDLLLPGDPDLTVPLSGRVLQLDLKGLVLRRDNVVQGELSGPTKLLLRISLVLIIHVPYFCHKSLVALKVVVDGEALDELRVQIVVDGLRSANLLLYAALLKLV